MNIKVHCSIFFGAKLENPKINKWGIIITTGMKEGDGGGVRFFFEKK